MNLSRRVLSWAVAGALLGATGYTCYRARARQAVLRHELVSSAARLAAGNQRAAELAVRLLQTIDQQVCRHHDQANDLAVLRQAQQIRLRTQGLLDTLRPSHAWASGAVATLPQQLARYTAFLRYHFPKAPLLALPVSLAAGRSWWNKPEAEPAATHAALTQLEAQVRRAEVDALSHQAQRIGPDCSFDVLRVLAAPVSETVEPGQYYQARLFFSWTSWRTYCHATLTANGQPLTQSGTGQLPVRLVVPPARPGQPDTVRAQWQGSIRATGYYRDTVVQVTVPYFIVKPKSR